MENEELQRLLEEEREKNRGLRREVRIMQVSLEQKNRALDAMHWVWCSGGCKDGSHRWCSKDSLTEEVVKLAEVNTRRLRQRWAGIKSREEA